MMKRAFVLLSGGIDSSVCLSRAIMDFAPSGKEGAFAIGAMLTSGCIGAGQQFGAVDWVEAISVDYGQRHRKEMEYAAATCAKFGIKHSVLNIRGILDGKGVMLADASVAIPDISYDAIKGVSPTYVPFRNGTLLSLITAHAQKWVNEQIKLRAGEYDDACEIITSQGAVQWATAQMRDSVGIYFGAHAEDAANWAYPDCCFEWTGAMANAIYIGTYMCVRLHVPLQWMDKASIIEQGTKLGVDWSSTWSCYAGGEVHCGTCPTCRARKAGFIAAGVTDPTVYAA